VTTHSPRLSRRVRVLSLGGLAVAVFTLGVAACTSDTERLADRSEEAAAAEDPQVPTSLADPLDPVLTTQPETHLTSISDLPDPSATAVSTSGPVAPAGNVDETVPEMSEATAPAVGLTDTADFGGQVTATITQVSAVQATATLPGEISGPAISATVEISNGSADTIGVDTVTVTLTDGAGNPASPISGDATPLQGVVAPGASAAGTYLFTVPPDQRNPVTITVNYSAGAPTLAFLGEVSGG
jgi:hypothetical protein